MDKKYYKPLPEYLTIKPSNIEGLGLFAVDNIDGDFRMGVTHVKDTRFADGFIRTALGSFFNHSETPNCRVIHGTEEGGDADFIFLETIRDIKAGEEITAHYTLYDPTK